MSYASQWLEDHERIERSCARFFAGEEPKVHHAVADHVDEAAEALQKRLDDMTRMVGEIFIMKDRAEREAAEERERIERPKREAAERIAAARAHLVETQRNMGRRR